MHFVNLYIKIKPIKRPHCLNSSKYNRKIGERCKIDTPITQITNR